jgi:Flp pilus assembly protein TadG
MKHVSQLLRVPRFVKSFASDNRGNVAMIFGLAMLPLIGFVGAAIDYSRANNARSAMQAALDSTSLMLSKDAATLTPANLTTKASDYFNAIFKHPEADTVAVTASYAYAAGGSHTINMSSSANVPTAFMRVLGYDTIKIASTATSTWGGARVRVALALDTTGSMAQAGKMDALKPAAKKLIDILKDMESLDATPGDVYISIVPFSKDVNVGPSNYNKDWVKWNDWDGANGTCSNNTYKNRTTCQNNGKTWTAANHSTWNGCVKDRDQNYDQSNTVPTTVTPGTLFWAEQHGDCPASLMPLSNDFTALKAKVDALYPDGNTNQGIGLAWAWQTLSDGPFAYPPHSPDYVYEKFVILMSDGVNTENRWSTNVNTINARQATTCATMKAAPHNITIFAIQVETGGGAEQAVMKNCATPGKFRKISDPTQLTNVFTDIATEISKLRLAY